MACRPMNCRTRCIAGLNIAYVRVVRNRSSPIPWAGRAIGGRIRIEQHMKETPFPPTADLPGWTSLLRGIRMRANTLDRTGDWPAEDLRLLADYGAMRWA